MSDIEVTREPLTYERHARASFFQDLAFRANGDNAAAARIARHGEEMRVEVPKREAERERRARAAGLELRVNPNRVDGQGGFFSPPGWLIDDFAGLARPMRVLANVIPAFPLPRGVSSVSLPRITAGDSTATENDLAAVSGTDLTEVAMSSPVTPVAGKQDVAMQLLEQSPPGAHLDFAIFQDLHADYDKQVETLLINGSGAGGQFTGILNLTTGAGGVNAVTFTSASPTLALLQPALGQAAAQIGDNRLAPPDSWLMRTARWAWITSQDVNLLAGGLRLAGWPALLSDAIPANLGVSTTQDAIICLRASDNMLMESEPRTEVALDTSLSGNLQARLLLHGQVAAIFRQPTGISTIQGTGTIVQAGF